MNLSREIIENVFLQIVDTVDSQAILEAGMYDRIGMPIAELSDVVFARNKEDKGYYTLKYNVEEDKLYFHQVSAEVKDEQPTSTDTAEETTTE